jgi:PilZ domain-containing protein
MPQPLCPRCSKEYIRRVSRVGLGERLMSLFYVYPFRCQLCGHRFKLLQWGVTYTRIEEDRREYERLAANFPMTFTSGAASGSGSVVDISMAGCTFHTDARVAEGSILRTALQVANDIPPINVEAAVIRSVKAGRTGVEFLRIENSERERLQRFIRGLMFGH